MENQQSVSAKDFFMNLGAMVGLYASAIAFISLLFSVINKALPEITQYYYFSSPNISFPVATLIIVFPLFLLLTYLLEKEYSANPMKKNSWIRRWSIYITLFVSGLILVGDLVTVLYKFLDGQDLTNAFVFKALAVLAVTAMIFGYYLQDIREKIPSWRKRFWAGFVSIVILVSIITGFSIIGSPHTQRLLRYDSQKTSDLQSIQWQIVSVWQRKGSIPATLAEVSDPISGYTLQKDPQTMTDYEYKKTGNTSFELCANFNLDSVNNSPNNDRMVSPAASSAIDIYYGKNENWDHGPGRQCFQRTIDPELYPVTKPAF